MSSKVSLLFLALLCSFQLNANVLKNSSFEKIRKEKPVYWSLHDWRGRSRLSLENLAHKGKKSLLVDLANSKNSRATFWQTCKMNVSAGREITLSFYTRTQNLSYGDKGHSYIQLRLMPVDKTKRKKYLTVYIKPSEKWTYLLIP